MEHRQGAPGENFDQRAEAVSKGERALAGEDTVAALLGSSQAHVDEEGGALVPRTFERELGVETVDGGLDDAQLPESAVRSQAGERASELWGERLEVDVEAELDTEAVIGIDRLELGDVDRNELARPVGARVPVEDP